MQYGWKVVDCFLVTNIDTTVSHAYLQSIPESTPGRLRPQLLPAPPGRRCTRRGTLQKRGRRQPQRGAACMQAHKGRSTFHSVQMHSYRQLASTAPVLPKIAHLSGLPQSPSAPRLRTCRASLFAAAVSRLMTLAPVQCRQDWAGKDVGRGEKPMHSSKAGYGMPSAEFPTSSSDTRRSASAPSRCASR